MGRAEDLWERLIEKGEEAIDELIRDRQPEELFLDFKRTATRESNRSLHGDDRANLAKAISGFANSEGGVIVWGVDCRNEPETGDLPGAKFPIDNPKRFVSWLQGAVSGCTLPPHPGVKHEAILSGGADRGFAATYVPKSNLAPHQAVQPQPSYYYIRAGSNFIPTPHGVLAGLFGRRPQPIIGHNFFVEPAELAVGEIVQISFTLNLFNQGPGLARGVYLNIFLRSPGGATEIRWIVTAGEDWSQEDPGGLGIIRSFVSRDPHLIAPGVPIDIVRLVMRLRPPFESDFSLNVSYGCDSSPTLERSTFVTARDLENLYDEFLAGVTDGYETTERLLGNLRDDGT